MGNIQLAGRDVAFVLYAIDGGIMGTGEHKVPRFLHMGYAITYNNMGNHAVYGGRGRNVGYERHAVVHFCNSNFPQNNKIMKKVTKIKLMVSAIVGIAFVIGATSCNTTSAYEKAYEKAAKKDAKTYGNASSKDGVMHQIDDSGVEYHQVYIEGKEID